MTRNNAWSWLAACLISFSSLAADDLVKISQAWARATMPGQEVGAAYMHLQSPVDATLTEASSPAADSIEIHKMAMNNGVMEMRMMETLPLPAGQAVKLEPGGFHLMLFDLKHPLKAGEQLMLTLKVVEKSGKIHTQHVRVPIKQAAD